MHRQVLNVKIPSLAIPAPFLKYCTPGNFLAVPNMFTFYTYALNFFKIIYKLVKMFYIAFLLYCYIGYPASLSLTLFACIPRISLNIFIAEKIENRLLSVP